MNDYEFLLTAHSNAQTVKGNWYGEIKQAYPRDGSEAYAPTTQEAYDKASAEADLITQRLIQAVASVSDRLAVENAPPVG